MRSSIVVGIGLLAMSVYIIASGLGYIDGPGIWSILFSLFFGGIFIDGVIKIGFGRMLFGLAFLAIIWDEQLGIESITPWGVLGPAFLGTIGLHLIFKGTSYKRYSMNIKGLRDKVNGKGDFIYCRSRLGSTEKYIDSHNLRGVQIDVATGAAEVNMGQAIAPSGEVFVYVNCNCGAVEIIVPLDWEVINEINSFGGALEDITNHSGTVKNTKVYLRGTSRMSSVEIRNEY